MTTTTVAEQTLQATSDEALLRTFASLTHSIDHASSSDHEASLRGQRLMVQNEILRRMGGAR